MGRWLRWASRFALSQVPNQAMLAPGEEADALKKELADLQEQARAMRAQWEAEKEAITRVRDLREPLEAVRHDMEAAERAHDLSRAALMIRVQHGPHKRNGDTFDAFFLK